MPYAYADTDSVSVSQTQSSGQTRYWYTNPQTGIGVPSARRRLAQNLVSPIKPTVISTTKVTKKAATTGSAAAKSKFAPELSSIDMLSAPPGQLVALTGRGFSPNAAENEVMVGGTPAKVMYSTPSMIQFVVPDMYWPQWYTPVTVKTRGIDGTGKLTLNIYNRVIPNNGVPMP